MSPARNTAERYGWVSITLHWVTVLLVVGMLCVGFYMTDLPRGPAKIQVYALHKSIGLTVLAITLVRLTWRLAVGAPPLVQMPRWQRIAAHASHVGIYVVLLAMPFTGWLFNSAAGFPLKWFGVVKIPALAAYDPGLKEIAEELHEGLAKVLIALVLIHVAAALQHHFLHRDATLHRMLPPLRDPTPKAPDPP